jgi:hypothetical protein
MCWSWIVSARHQRSRVPDPAWRPFGGARQGLDEKSRNNPMQSRMDPGSRHSCCAADCCKGALLPRPNAKTWCSIGPQPSARHTICGSQLPANQQKPTRDRKRDTVNSFSSTPSEPLAKASPSARNYSPKTLKILFALSGNRCAHPKCLL